MDKEKQELLVKQIEENFNLLYENFDKIIEETELKIRSEEALRNALYHYIGKDNIVSLDIETTEDGIMLTNISLKRNEFTKHWIEFFERNNKGVDIDE